MLNASVNRMGNSVRGESRSERFPKTSGYRSFFGADGIGIDLRGAEPRMAQPPSDNVDRDAALERSHRKCVAEALGRASGPTTCASAIPSFTRDQAKVRHHGQSRWLRMVVSS